MFSSVHLWRNPPYESINTTNKAYTPVGGVAQGPATRTLHSSLPILSAHAIVIVRGVHYTEGPHTSHDAMMDTQEWAGVQLFQKALHRRHMGGGHVQKRGQEAWRGHRQCRLPH